MNRRRRNRSRIKTNNANTRELLSVNMRNGIDTLRSMV